MKDDSNPKVTVAFRVRPEDRGLLDELAELLGRQLGTEVTKAQAFAVAVKEAIARRKDREGIISSNGERR